MADALSWLQQMLGGGGQRAQGDDALTQLQRRVDRPYDYDQAYQPQALPQSPSAQDAVTQLYGMTGIPDMQQAYDAWQRGEYPQAVGQGAYGAANAATLAVPALRGLSMGARAAAPVVREAAGAIPAMLADETGALRIGGRSPRGAITLDTPLPAVSELPADELIAGVGNNRPPQPAAKGRGLR